MKPFARFRFRPGRKILRLALQTGIANYAWSHRRQLLDRVTRRQPVLPDPTKPSGDRLVVAQADGAAISNDVSLDGRGPERTVDVRESHVRIETIETIGSAKG